MASYNQMDLHYQNHVTQAEAWMAELIALHADDSPAARTRRAQLAAEITAIEAHLTRELTEAFGLAIGHRTL